jgi:transcriptional regulator with XRE-family HTH domain
MENINQRVFRLLGNKHGIQKDLADFLGISDRNVNMWKKRGSGIDSEYIPGIADYLGVTDTYLLRGEDESFTGEELKLIGLYRSLSEQGKSEVMNFIQYTFQFDNEDIRKQLKDMEKELTKEKEIG